MVELDSFGSRPMGTGSVEGLDLLEFSLGMRVAWRKKNQHAPAKNVCRLKSCKWLVSNDVT